MKGLPVNRRGKKDAAAMREEGYRQAVADMQAANNRANHPYERQYMTSSNPYEQQQQQNQEQRPEPQQGQPQGSPPSGFFGFLAKNVEQIIQGAARGGMSFLSFIILFNGAMMVLARSNKALDKFQETTTNVGMFVDTSKAEGALGSLNNILVVVLYLALFGATAWMLLRLRLLSVIASIVVLFVAFFLYGWLTGYTDFIPGIFPLLTANPFSLYGYNAF